MNPAAVLIHRNWYLMFPSTFLPRFNWGAGVRAVIGFLYMAVLTC
jgi:hypothetical protein